jgi:quercetin dioxygenase-like cupin family protein
MPFACSTISGCPHRYPTLFAPVSPHWSAYLRITSSTILTASGKRYLEFIRVAAMSIGIYVLPKGSVDPQKPHHEDEVYYVVKGRAKMQIGSDHANLKAGSIIFVEAELEHPFYDIEEELEVLVFFAPAEME